MPARRAPQSAELSSFAGLQHSVLARRELENLLRRMAKARDVNPRRIQAYRRLRNRVVASHLRFAVTIARRFRNRGLPLEDLVQQAAMGLMRACETFEPAKGFAFSTYAMWWARHYVERALADLAKTIRTPVHRLDAGRKVSAARGKHLARTGVEPTPEQLAHLAKLPLRTVKEILERPTLGIVSLDAVVVDDGRPLTLADAVEDPDAVDPLDRLLAREREAEVRRLASELPEREAQVIAARFGLGDRHGEGRTLKEVADGPLGGLSRERARQLEVGALRWLRGRVEPRDGYPSRRTARPPIG